VALACLFCVFASVRVSSVDAQHTEAPLLFKRFFILMFENRGIKNTLASSFWADLAKHSLLLDNFYGVTHPSQPNYIAQLSGDTLGVPDGEPIDIEATNLVDLLEAKGVTWRAYMDGYVPLKKGKCAPDKKIGTYRRKHNPFMSFNNIRNNKTRCQNIVPAAYLDTDIILNQVPSFLYLSPDMNNNGHDTDLDYAGHWLRLFLNKYLYEQNLMKDTLLMITFDEDEDEPGQDNRIPAFLLGDLVKTNSVDHGKYNHYSITKTIELNFGLGNLGRNDVNATDFLHLLRRREVNDGETSPPSSPFIGRGGCSPLSGK